MLYLSVSLASSCQLFYFKSSLFFRALLDFRSIMHQSTAHFNKSLHASFDNAPTCRFFYVGKWPRLSPAKQRNSQVNLIQVANPLKNSKQRQHKRSHVKKPSIWRKQQRDLLLTLPRKQVKEGLRFFHLRKKGQIFITAESCQEILLQQTAGVKFRNVVVQTHVM